MPWLAPPVFATAGNPTAAALNSLSTDLGWLHDPPRCGVTRSAALAVATGVNTAVPFDTELWDTDTMHDTVVNTSRITCRSVGLYIATALIPWAVAVASTWRNATIRLNGGASIGQDDRGSNPAAGSPTSVTLSSLPWPLAVGDFLELVLFQASGGALNVTPIFSVARVGGG